jgi:hypothetical protein
MTIFSNNQHESITGLSCTSITSSLPLLWSLSLASSPNHSGSTSKWTIIESKDISIDILLFQCPFFRKIIPRSSCFHFVFCRLLFVLIYFLFWSLCCLFFFNIGILIAPLVSSNSSCDILYNYTSLNIWLFPFLLVLPLYHPLQVQWCVYFWIIS